MAYFSCSACLPPFSPSLWELLNVASGHGLGDSRVQRRSEGGCGKAHRPRRRAAQSPDLAQVGGRTGSRLWHFVRFAPGWLQLIPSMVWLANLMVAYAVPFMASASTLASCIDRSGLTSLSGARLPLYA
jgi:hypothetical protein